MGTGSNSDDVAAGVSRASAGFSGVRLVMDGVFGFRGVGLGQRRNTDGGCLRIDAVGGGYGIRVRVLIDVVLQRVHGWVAKGRSFAPGTRV